MKKITFLFFILPFIIKAQAPSENKKPETEAVKLAKDEKRKLLESYRQRIIKGESFSTLARLHSEDPGSAAEGGMYQNISKGTMVAEFEAVAFKLKPAEISEVFETQYGFHIVQVIEKKGDARDLRHILLMVPK